MPNTSARPSARIAPQTLSEPPFSISETKPPSLLAESEASAGRVLVVGRNGLHGETARSERRHGRLGTHVRRRVQQVGRVVREGARAVADGCVGRAHRDAVGLRDEQLAPAHAVGRVAVGEREGVRRAVELQAHGAETRIEPRRREAALPAREPDVLLRDHEPHGAPVGHELNVRRHDRDEPLALARGLCRRRCVRRHWRRRSAAAGTSGSRPCRARSARRHASPEIEPRVLVDREVAERVRHRDRRNDGRQREAPDQGGAEQPHASLARSRRAAGASSGWKRGVRARAFVSAVRARSRLPAQAAIAPRCHESCGSIVPRRFASLACGRA